MFWECAQLPPTQPSAPQLNHPQFNQQPEQETCRFVTDLTWDITHDRRTNAVLRAPAAVVPELRPGARHRARATPAAIRARVRDGARACRCVWRGRQEGMDGEHGEEAEFRCGAAGAVPA